MNQNLMPPWHICHEKPNVAGFSIMGGFSRLTPHQPKLWLIFQCFRKPFRKHTHTHTHTHIQTLFCPQNVDFAHFEKFLAVFAKSFPNS